MHILLTDAGPLGPNCQAALTDLNLPHFSALLGRLARPLMVRGSATSLTPLAERLYAEAIGLPAADGLVPWAALDAQRWQLPTLPAGQGWGWITPCHWKINSDHIAMLDPSALQLSAPEAAQLLDAMQPYFAEDGLTLHLSEPGTWLAAGTALHQLPTASLARVSADVVDPWMAQATQARVLRRLQNEMQMLLYTHPVNNAREASGLPTVNSFWISGTGALDAGAGEQLTAAEVVRYDALHSACRQDHAAAWVAAWRELDNGPIHDLLQSAQAGEAVQLTLCGANNALRFEGPVKGFWPRLQNRWRQPGLAHWLRCV